MPGFPGVSIAERLREIHRISRDVQVDIEPVRMDATTARMRLEAGHPILAGRSVPVDAKAAGHILDALCRAPDMPEAIRLRESVQERPIAFQAVADVLMTGGDRALAEERGVPHAFLSFVVLAALRPSFRRHAERLQPLAASVPWHRPVCPVCGSVPSLAELRGEPGCRYLRCALCEAEWRVPRLRCPFCGTTDPTRLRYLAIEGHPGMRLDLCDACRRYLKTRVAPGGEAEADVFGLDLATLPLDALAQEQDYRGSGMALP